MSLIEKRLSKLEGKHADEFVMAALDSLGYEGLVEYLSTTKFHGGRRPISMARFLTLDLVGNVLALEDFRGKVPDNIIQEAYSHCRNWAVPPEQLNTVRFRAGVIDENGCVMPGYRFVEGNGCIVADDRT